MSVWKKRLMVALGALAALVLAFSAGRFAAPSKIITATQIRFVTRTETVTKTVEVEKHTEAKAQVVYVDRVIYKDGTVHEKTETRTVETEKTDAKTDSTADAKTDSTADTKTTQVITNDAPRLTVMVLAGADLKPIWQPIPNAGPLALGLAVNYRIAGPLVIGAWGVHTGAFGVAVGAQF